MHCRFLTSCKRLGKFGLTLEAKKTKLVEFGRFAQKWTSKRGRRRPETIYFSDSRCTAPAIGKATFGLDCVQRSVAPGNCCPYRGRQLTRVRFVRSTPKSPSASPATPRAR